MKQLDAYEVIRECDLADIRSKGIQLRHKKTGARIAVISNDDDNKVFCVTFRTPPEDETGVAHIIEHTVLCGSDKYPVKDPFVELAKGSLNTFLNAITYPDKTLYPVASCNDRDYKNLMSVYMDAVFHPNIYKYQEIFKQEGWHYEMEDIDAPVTINGVVYNEMKGAYSSADRALSRNINKVLFPDTTYGKESGGDPKKIPELTYEYYLDFHRRYYHPSNSYIYLYGDMDIEERLEWLDKEYLSHYDRLEVDSEVKMQKPYDKCKELVFDYPIAAEDSEEDQAYLSYSAVIGDSTDRRLMLAFDAICEALIVTPGSPVEKALLDAGIGMNVYPWFDTSMLQPIFTVVAQNANTRDKDRFVNIVTDTFRKVAEEGISHDSLLAALNRAEFYFREADYGGSPKGLMYLINCLDTWLYDDDKPFWNLEKLDEFRFLREQIGTGYFEELIQKYILSNPHSAVVVANPKKGLNSKEEEELKKSLEDYKNSLSAAEKEKLIADTKALKAYQQEESSKEDMEKIPLLSRSDIKKTIRPLHNTERTLAGTKVVTHDIVTNGIHYLSLMFDARDVAQEDIPYLGILAAVLGSVDKEHYNYTELSDQINIHTGGIFSYISRYDAKDGSDDPQVFIRLKAKVLTGNVEKAMELIREILYTSKFRDSKRMKELISQNKANTQVSLSNRGNRTAAGRGLSGLTPNGYYGEATGGILYYRMLCELEESVKKDVTPLAGKLEELVKKLFVKERLLISYTGEDALYQEMQPHLEKLIAGLPGGSACGGSAKFTLTKKSEGFMDASQIQYVARCGNFKHHGFAYKGTLHILENIMDMGYLWNQIRVLGGAYGCGCRFDRSGEAYFTSYRDPNLSRTNEVYENAVDYIRNFDVDDRDMTKYIIGTFSSLDYPRTPDGEGERSLNVWLEGIPEELLQKEREEILAAQQEDIRALADLTASVLSDQVLCVVGNEDTIRKEAAMFDRTENLV